MPKTLGDHRRIIKHRHTLPRERPNIATHRDHPITLAVAPGAPSSAEPPGSSTVRQGGPTRPSSAFAHDAPAEVPSRPATPGSGYLALGTGWSER